MAIITLNNNSLSSVTALPSAIPTGKVLQVSDMAIITSDQVLATSTYTDLTGASVNITPTSTSNKIFMCININCSTGTSEGFGMKFLRNSTSILTTTHAYAQYINAAGSRSMATFNFIDSPATTSQITYKVQVASYNGLSINFQNSAQTTFYLMEIAG